VNVTGKLLLPPEPLCTIVVKLYHPYTQFPRDVRLYDRRIATFSAHRDFYYFFTPYKYSYLFTYLLFSFLLITVYNSSME